MSGRFRWEEERMHKSVMTFGKNFSSELGIFLHYAQLFWCESSQGKILDMHEVTLPSSSSMNDTDFSC